MLPHHLLRLTLALAIALIACLPAGAQSESPSGSYFHERGALGILAAEQDSAGAGVVLTAFDDSSLLLERQRPPEQETRGVGFMGKMAGLVRGRVMLEGGYAYVSDSAAGTTISQHIVPDLLMRVGLTERLELRIGWPGASVVNQSGALGSSSSTTTLDPNVGLMMDLCCQDGWRPQTAVLGAVPITLSGNTFAMNSLQPVSGLLYQWHLTERLSWGGDSGLALFRDSGDHYRQWQQGLDVDYLLTDRVGVFSGWQMTADDGSADDVTRHMLSAGASWLCTDRLQLTWRAGVGMNDPAPDFLTDVRFGFLF
jgi:hypothetical protein